MSTIDQTYITENPPARDRRPNHWTTPSGKYTHLCSSRVW